MSDRGAAAGAGMNEAERGLGRDADRRLRRSAAAE
jgi:hypothetical protein